ncbi:hypothetical protein BDZ91DRAFT_764509 [Kalaharituber pfeilii]|nr:hypothetical protein BDZ91DRAFT_764509 [Kalaharituber pfeilii]
MPRAPRCPHLDYVSEYFDSNDTWTVHGFYEWCLKSKYEKLSTIPKSKNFLLKELRRREKGGDPRAAILLAEIHTKKHKPSPKQVYFPVAAPNFFRERFLVANLSRTHLQLRSRSFPAITETTFECRFLRSTPLASEEQVILRETTFECYCGFDLAPIAVSASTARDAAASAGGPAWLIAGAVEEHPALRTAVREDLFTELCASTPPLPVADPTFEAAVDAFLSDDPQVPSDLSSARYFKWIRRLTEQLELLKELLRGPRWHPYLAEGWFNAQVVSPILGGLFLLDPRFQLLG